MKRNTEQWIGEFDFSDPYQLKQMFKETFEDERRAFLEMVGMSQDVDIDMKRYTKRMDTGLSTVHQAREMVGDDYPDYPGSSYFEQDWAYINATVARGYDAIDRNHDLLLAAAIWILDTLSEKYNVFAIERDFLPELTEEEAEDVPSFIVGSDSVHSDALLMKTVYALMHRNDDCKVYKPKGEMRRNILDEATVRNKHRQEVPSRNRFEKLISGLGAENIEEAVNEFKEKYWFLAKAYFHGLCKNHARRYELMDRHDRLEQKRKRYVKDGMTIKARINPDGSFDPLGGKTSDDFRNAIELDQAIGRCADGIEEQVHEKMNYTEMFKDALIMSETEAEEMMPEEFRERMKDFRIENPYRLAFALLYLADRGDDLIWNYYFGTCLTSMIADTLPWKYGFDDFFNAELKYKYGENESEPLPDIFRVQYGNDDFEHFEEPKNMAQLMYELTETIMPRDIDPYQWVGNYWNEIGVSEQDQKIMRLAMGVMNAYRWRVPGTYKQRETENSQSDTLIAKTADLQEKVRLLEAKVNALAKENKSLKEASWNAAKQSARLSEKLETAFRETKADREELAKLREAIFVSQNPEPEVPDNTVSLPFEAKERIIVCGGHDSFVKQFTQLITGNVRILSNVKINEDLIRNADTIWIQTNALSHSDYYKIMDLCRKMGKPVNYFLYASARKCAEQVVKESQNRK